MTGGEALLQSLKRQQVDTIFGLVGNQLAALYDAWIEHPEIREVGVRHEQGAAYMALGYAWASGWPSICVTASGPPRRPECGGSHGDCCGGEYTCSAHQRAGYQYCFGQGQEIGSPARSSVGDVRTYAQRLARRGFSRGRANLRAFRTAA